MAKYKYVGKGQGVPGLAHEVDEAQLTPKEKDLLREAIQAGNYVPAPEPKKPGAAKEV